MVDGLVRFKANHLYHTTALYDELIDACKRMLQSNAQ
jgi:hypothetical protein